MKLQTLIIGVLLGSLFMGALGLVLGDASAKQGLTFDNETAIYDIINDSYVEYLEVQGKFNTTTETGENLDVLGGFVDKGVAAVKIFFGSATNAISLTSEGADRIGIPKSIQYAMVAIILIFLFIIMIKLFTRTDP